MTIRRPLRAFFLLVAAFCMVGVPGEAWSQSAGAPASQPPAARGGATPRPAEPVKLPGRLIGAGVREIGWDDLMPEDWDPLKLLEGRGLDAISDGDPRSEALMREIREQWDQAPTRGELEGLRIRIPGYVVPLDMLGGDIREFLLVPYMGACIHTPPPPANQIIQVVSARASGAANHGRGMGRRHAQGWPKRHPHGRERLRARCHTHRAVSRPITLTPGRARAPGQWLSRGRPRVTAIR
jgi:hypothetical protein